MNFLVTLLICCALCANLFPTVLPATLKKRIDNIAHVVKYKFFGFPKKDEIALEENVCNYYDRNPSNPISNGDIACLDAYKTHFKDSQLFSDAELTEKANHIEITYDCKLVDMVICGYISAKNSNARFLATNGRKGNVRSYYYFIAEDITQLPKPNVKYVAVQSIPLEKWEALLTEVRNYWDEKRATIKAKERPEQEEKRRAEKEEKRRAEKEEKRRAEKEEKRRAEKEEKRRAEKEEKRRAEKEAAIIAKERAAKRGI